MASHFKQVPEAPEERAPEAASHGRGRVVAIAAGVTVGVLAAAYLGGVAVFGSVFIPGTTLDGADVSLMRVEDVAAAKAASHDGYSISVTGNGLDLTISGADVDLSCDGAAYVEEALSEESPWAWPLELFQSRELTAEERLTISDDKLSALLAPAVAAATTQAAPDLANHGISFSPEAGAFVLDEAATARELDPTAVTEAVRSAILAQESEVVIGDECLVEQTSDLTATVDAANAMLGAAGTTLLLSGTQVLDVPADLLASWIVIGDDLSVSLNEEAVGEWVTQNVGALDTTGRERTYTRADGKQVSVSGGTWGIITNEAETTTMLVESLRNGTAQALEIPLKQSTGVAADAGGRDWGNRYIDIDLTEQHVRMYDESGALIWESDCVSGDTTKGYDTPTGVNPINSNKATNQTLKGLDYNGDGEPDYTSYVDYWIPFVGNLVALHDADWRSSFGGTIYRGNGSHGCVNLPVGKAAELYDLTRVGDCVVVHY